MKLRTSFFNPAVLKKDITRFFPLWGLYGIVLFLVLFLNRVTGSARLAREMTSLMRDFSMINLLYAGLCANVLLGDLYQGRMCNALHALPVRREGWLMTHTVAGLLFSLVPNILAAGALMPLLGEFYYMAALWLAVVTLQYLFFFGLAMFSALCAGNRLGMAAVYLIINFFAVFAFVVADQFYKPLLYGIDFTADGFNFFSPAIWLLDASYVRFTYHYETDIGQFLGVTAQTWYYLAAVAVIGLGLLGASAALYRKRKLEKAGDFLAVKALEPVFLIIATLGGAVLLYAAGGMFGIATSYPLMAVGLIVGYFGGRMLLERTVRVFRWKNLLVFGVFGAVLAASLWVTAQDPLGITWYVPDTEQVTFARIYLGDDSYAYSDPGNICPQAEDPGQIDAVRQLHAQLAAEREEKSDGVLTVEVMYRLENGKTLYRYYTADDNSRVYDALRERFSQPEYIFNVRNWEKFRDSVYSVELNLYGNLSEMTFNNSVITDRLQIAALLDAIEADCREHTTAQNFVYHLQENPMCWLTLSSTATDSIRGGYTDLVIYPCNTHILELLSQVASG